MDLKELATTQQTILYQKEVAGGLLTVKETDQYRWFEYGGCSVQSVMSKALPEQMLSPVYQSLLMFLLLNKSPDNVLSLGLGGASIERRLAAVSSISMTSVDASQTIIDMAKRYFYLPKKVDVICQKAELYIQKIDKQYEVIICDLFIGEKSPDFLFEADFYESLKAISTSSAVVMINLQADTDEQLLGAILAIKKYFPYVALIEFEGFINIIFVCSAQAIPEREVLQNRIASFTQIDLSYLVPVIEKMRYIPHSINL